MGAPDLIEINKEIMISLNNVLKKGNREKFALFISLQPYIDAINAVMIFERYPESIYVAGSLEWAMSGRVIRKEDINKPIRVLLPYIEMKDKGKVHAKRAADEAGILLYGRYPEYEIGYTPCYVYDYMQTEGVSDRDIEGMPDKPDFLKIMRKERDVSVEITSDDMYLRNNVSYFDRENEEQVLYLKDGISDAQTDIEIIKAFLDYRFDIVLNYGFITTGKREEYKKKVVKMAAYAVLCRYRLNRDYGDLLFINQIEEFDLSDKLRFIEDVLVLLRSVISICETKRTFSLDEIMIIRGLLPAIILFSKAKRKEDGKSMILTYLKKMTVKCCMNESECILTGIVNGVYEKISSMSDETYDDFINLTRELKVYTYPVFVF